MRENYRISRISTYLVALFVLLLFGCVSMTSSKEELQHIGDKEGVVIGSVLLTVAQGDTNESGWAFLKGRKAEDLEYAVMFSEKKEGFTLFNTPYTLPAIPGKEAFFVKKLPAGNYEMDNIGPTGFLAPTLLSFPLGLNFQVKPQETTYIGKLVAILPDRLSQGARFKFTVQDAKQEMIGELMREYPSIVPNAVKALARRDEGPNVVPGNTVASPLLQRDTLTIINVMDGAEDETCRKRNIVNTEIIKKATQPEDTGEERWIVDRCGKTIPYLVTFRPSAGGGTDISVKQEK